jgi:translation initiation factor RLI1
MVGTSGLGKSYLVKQLTAGKSLPALFKAKKAASLQQFLRMFNPTKITVTVGDSFMISTEKIWRQHNIFVMFA